MVFEEFKVFHCVLYLLMIFKIIDNIRTVIFGVVNVCSSYVFALLLFLFEKKS